MSPSVRAITHLHTRHSYDSALPVHALVRRLDGLGVKLALINDHDSFAGSLEARALTARLSLSIAIPVAAEISTELGDVIVAFPSIDAPPVSELKHWHSLKTLTRRYGGLIWLPHPYVAHRDVEELAAGADVVEIFNSRCQPAQNEQAADLCRRHRKSEAYGADAHLKREVAWFVEYPEGRDPITMLRSDATCAKPITARGSDHALSRCIAGVKRREPGLVLASAKRYVQRRVREREALRA